MDKAFYIRCLLMPLLWMAIQPAFAQYYEYDLVIPNTPVNLGGSKTRLDGPFGRVIREVLRLEGHNFSSRITSSGHAYNAFYAGKYACVTPASRKYYIKDKKYIDSMAYHMTEWVVVTRKNEKIIRIKDELKGKFVSLPYDPSALIPVLPDGGYEYEVQGSFFLNLKKVALGRVDVAVMPRTQLDRLLKSDPVLSNLKYSSKAVIARVPDTFMCHDNQRGREMIMFFNRALNTIRERALKKLKKNDQN